MLCSTFHILFFVTDEDENVFGCGEKENDVKCADDEWGMFQGLAIWI